VDSIDQRGLSIGKTLPRLGQIKATLIACLMAPAAGRLTAARVHPGEQSVNANAAGIPAIALAESFLPLARNVVAGKDGEHPELFANMRHLAASSKSRQPLEND
jgi:hypothetical protein